MFYVRCGVQYWVIFGTFSKTFLVTLLKVEPSWMSDRKEDLGGLLLTDLSLCESHDAAAYK
jgi:hypothetical protein